MWGNDLRFYRVALHQFTNMLNKLQSSVSRNKVALETWKLSMVDGGDVMFTPKHSVSARTGQLQLVLLSRKQTWYH